MTAGSGARRDVSFSSRSDARVEQLRVPPQSIESEQAVLGGLLLDAGAFDRVADRLVEEDFYRRDHRLIYRAIRELTEKNRPCDMLTVREWLDAKGLLGEGLDPGYLFDLAANIPGAANIQAYAETVRDKAVQRRLIEVGTTIVNDGFQPEGRDSAELLAKAEQEVFAIAESHAHGRQDFVPVNKALSEAFDVLQQRAESGGGITGLPTGYAEFDRMTAGLQPTDLIVLAARPAMGKTTFALNIAEYGALKSKKAVAVFSMEMSSSQLALRLISSLGRVNATRLRVGDLEDEDWGRVNGAISLLSGARIFIDDTPALSPDVLRAKARRLRREHDLGLIVIDYLQLMQVPGNSENRATEISAISRSLKALAKELKVPVLALSQLNRSLESRTDKRPVMADLRESGAIEQDADMIVFIYRDDYYHKENSPDKGLAEIIIGKQRNGPTDSFKLKFFGEYTRFDNLAYDSAGSFEGE
ncbi:replicative DNA helicase [Thermomonas sp.]|uniref:replicative DNA helicase n=1 Tax=Thermomonas sp. TaxID=1971895 RepID=UPI002622DA9E|nr:replicative DNA helicase [Thermomonas sp.]